jgi:hypothetical protein
MLKPAISRNVPGGVYEVMPAYIRLNMPRKRLQVLGVDLNNPLPGCKIARFSTSG